jgi:ABC-type taurine transport system ATPase subunit
MLTKITIRNFKKLGDVDIELGKSVVLIGPNNSGKTAALQALALWDIGLRQWLDKRGKTPPAKRPGVTINRTELTSISVPTVQLLWRDLNVRYTTRKDGKQDTQNIRIDILVEGVTDGKEWKCGLEFDYANEESFYCRPLRTDNSRTPERMPIPQQAAKVRVAFLPPMSGLADREFIKQPGEIGMLIGQGQTAQVLRNMCYQISSESETHWKELCNHIKRLFGVELLAPNYYAERSEITMAYKEGGDIGKKLDVSASGRGLQQTLLLLAHLYANPGTVLLLDEPDAHLEVFRQRQTYKLLTDVAEQQGSQIIVASHSEVILNEAADKDIVIAFVGRPHRIDDRGSQVLKALKEIGFDQYYLAEQRGWVLYMEGSTDLAILQTFAQILGHRAAELLERPFVHYVANQPQKARDHFYGLREAYPELFGVALFDRLNANLKNDPALIETMWERREIENYLCMEEVLFAYARSESTDDLFGIAERNKREQAMKDSINEVAGALATLGKPDWKSPDIKATDEFLDPVFKKYFKRLQLPNLLLKNEYYVLAHLVPKNKVDPEVAEKLDILASVADKAKPRED